MTTKDQTQNEDDDAYEPVVFINKDGTRYNPDMKALRKKHGAEKLPRDETGDPEDDPVDPMVKEILGDTSWAKDVPCPWLNRGKPLPKEKAVKNSVRRHNIVNSEIPPGSDKALHAAIDKLASTVTDIVNNIEP